ncbi:MAG: ABC transporter permease [Holophaga sp.]|nr:ABC transporter permease [Holophaga sp.]
MGLELLTSIIFATVMAGTPLIIAGLGELVTEKAGVLNLGCEGMMSVGAVAAFAVAYFTHNYLLAVLAGMGAGMAVSMLFAVAALTLMASQVACGLALSIFGVGLASFVGKPLESMTLMAGRPVAVPLLWRIPVLGPALFHQQSLVYFSWALLAGVAWFLYRSKPGLVLRAVGEAPVSAHDIGYPVVRIRYLAVLFGGAMAGIAGAFMVVFYTPLWVEGMIAGRGWISVALVVFATWRPLRVLIGAYLFGGCMIAQMFVQASGIHLNVPAQFLSSLPYVATILVLVLISHNRSKIRLNSPASLGQPFLPDV